MKFLYDSLDQIPEALRSFYKQRGDGKWQLECEGAVAREKVDEFRETNTRLLKENGDLKKQYDGIDVAEYQRLKSIEDDLKKGKLKDGKTVEQLVEERVGTMKAEHEKTVTKLTTELDTSRTELSRLTISEAAVAAALAKGLRPTAKDDLIARVTGVFRLHEGKPTAFQGETIMGGKDGDPLSIEEFVEGLVTKAAHLFEPSSGTGAGGSGKGAPATGANPWSKEHFNVTEQMKIIKANRAQAITLAAKHGVVIPA